MLQNTFEIDSDLLDFVKHELKDSASPYPNHFQRLMDVCSSILNLRNAKIGTLPRILGYPGDFILLSMNSSKNGKIII